MQWTDQDQAGFTTGQPWLPINPNYQTINVAQALADKSSIFYTYQKLIALRKSEDWLIYGDYELIDSPDSVFAYRRHWQGLVYLVVVNLSSTLQTVSFDDTLIETVIANGPSPSTLQEIELAPWEAFCVNVTS